MKDAKQLRNEILMLKSEEEIKAYVSKNEHSIWDVDHKTRIGLALLCLAEVCGGIPGSFQLALKDLKELR